MVSVRPDGVSVIRLLHPSGDGTDLSKEARRVGSRHTGVDLKIGHAFLAQEVLVYAIQEVVGFDSRSSAVPGFWPDRTISRIYPVGSCAKACPRAVRVAFFRRSRVSPRDMCG